MTILGPKSVFSSHVNTVAYDTDKHELYVEWDSGKTSIYSGVPQEIADQAMNAWSVGSFLAQNVKSRFEHRYL